MHRGTNSVNPNFSVVIPCYNGEKFIGETISSALDQTIAPNEVIVVDDGSTDRSADIVRDFSAPVRLIQQENQGESVARNRGLTESTAEWVAFLDADDLWEKDKLAKQLAACSKTTIACVNNLQFIGAVSRLATPWKLSDQVLGSLEHICDFNAFLPSSLIVRRKNAPLFATWTKYGEDYLYSLELSLLGPIAFVDEPLTHYRIHHKSQSAHPLSLIRQDASIRRWFELNSSQIGNSRCKKLRDQQLRVLVKKARQCRQSRDWTRFKPLMEYLTTLPPSDETAAFLAEKTWPRWLYKTVDIVDYLFPTIRSRNPTTSAS